SATQARLPKFTFALPCGNFYKDLKKVLHATQATAPSASPANGKVVTTQTLRHKTLKAILLKLPTTKPNRWHTRCFIRGGWKGGTQAGHDRGRVHRSAVNLESASSR